MTPERVKELSRLLREIEWLEAQKTPDAETILECLGYGTARLDYVRLAECMSSGLEELRQADLRKLQRKLEAE